MKFRRGRWNPVAFRSRSFVCATRRMNELKIKRRHNIIVIIIVVLIRILFISQHDHLIFLLYVRVNNVLDCGQLYDAPFFSVYIIRVASQRQNLQYYLSKLILFYYTIKRCFYIFVDLFDRIYSYIFYHFSIIRLCVTARPRGLAVIIFAEITAERVIVCSLSFDFTQSRIARADGQNTKQ